MQFTPTAIAGCWLIEPELLTDNRGFFARLFSREEFGKRGLAQDIVQTSLSFNATRGTLRGMHYQIAPFEETKIVQCIRGRIHDVVLDLRPKSTTFSQWIALELAAQTRRLLCIPTGCAHGFQTGNYRGVPQSLKDAVEREYGMTAAKYGKTLEIDHIVSLELGGSNDIANLFPERASPAYPSPPLPGPIGQQNMRSYRNNLQQQQWQRERSGVTPDSERSREIQQQLNEPSLR